MSKRALAREANALARSFCIQVAARLLAGIELADADTALEEAADLTRTAAGLVGPSGGLWS